MDILLFISQFLYRIRYWLLWGTLFVTGLVIYFTQFLPYSYTVKSSLYAGITSSTSLDGASVNFSVVAATFDNLVNLPILAIICRQGKINPVIGQKLNGRFFVLALRAINRNRRSAAFFGDFHGRNVSHAVAEINHSPVRDPPFFVRHKSVSYTHLTLPTTSRV